MFDDIRPYYDHEIPAAMQRIADDPLFPILSRFVFPDKDVQAVQALVKSCRTAHDFQLNVMYPAHERIIESTMTSFTCTGVEQLQKDKAYLFVSNHRDIMLDASLLQKVLVDNGLDSAEISFGANLMHPSLVVDIGKSNKMYKVERPGNNIREFYRCSLHLSDYIRTAIVENHHSVWIAQRNGRTKDGLDRTDVGVVKMFSMSRKDDAVLSLADLHIVPVSVSYEIEPCDIAKAVELWRRSQGPYTKRPGEDMESILSGILADKGHVHFHVCAPITENELADVFEQPVPVYHKRVAELIDRRICSSYRLFPNNYIAHDMLRNTSDYADYYTPDDVRRFTAHLDELAKLPIFCDEIKEIFLRIYANPVDSKNV